jgi:hypothetical protein
MYEETKPYEFQEFPKWVLVDEVPVLVQTAEEEAALKPKRGRKAKAETTEAE